MEFIGIRTATNNREKVIRILQAFIDDVQKADSVGAITLLRRVSIESDLCVHLRHDAKAPAPTRSRLGLHLANELKAFGLVHHSIWVEIPDSSQGPD